MWCTDPNWYSNPNLHVFKMGDDGKDSLPTGLPGLVVNDHTNQNLLESIRTQVKALKAILPHQKQWWEKVFTVFPQNKDEQKKLPLNHVALPDVPTVRAQEEPFIFNLLPFQHPQRNYERNLVTPLAESMAKERYYKPMTTCRNEASRMKLVSITESDGHTYPDLIMTQPPPKKRKTTEDNKRKTTEDSQVEQPIEANETDKTEKVEGIGTMFFCKTKGGTIRIGKILQTTTASITLRILRCIGTHKWIEAGQGDNFVVELDRKDIKPKSEKTFRLTRTGYMPQDIAKEYKLLLNL